MKVAVFGAASNRVSDSQKRDAKELGRLLSSFLSIDIMTGGGDVGLMKEVADGFLEKTDHNRFTGVPVVGFNEPATPSRLVYADSIGSRYDLYFKDVDLVIVLPGGHGTLGEFYTAISNKILFNSKYDIVIYDPSHEFSSEVKHMDDGLQFLNTIQESGALFKIVTDRFTMTNVLVAMISKE